MNPPLSGPLGNFLWLAAAHYMGTTKSHDGTEDVLPSLVGELRGAISKVSDQGLNSKEFGLVVRSSLSINPITGSKPCGTTGELLACLPVPCTAGGSGCLGD
ncbi:hypothetical protein CRG98_042228 [Punica granatum]|uniref:Uncharacterized protein n=1 Tax=Punica granatum TaxID=22663 RepID=A0A2I0I088_PUNGR|nr:hypothetical protein CRG98_042228 [Punica granatum]